MFAGKITSFQAAPPSTRGQDSGDSGDNGYNLKCLKSCRDQKYIAPDALGLNLTMVPSVDRFVDSFSVDKEYFIIGSLVRKAVSFPIP